MTLKKYSALFILTTAVLILDVRAGVSGPTADAILARADEIRIPAGDSLLRTTVVSVRPGGRQDTADYEVLLKGSDKTLIKTLSPAMDRGTSILMVGHDLWVFLPKVQQPVRVSLQQRLMGEVSNGDLARANFVGDYQPKIVEEKSSFYQLELTAKSDEVTYGRVRLWVQKPSLRPIRAAFYASSGRLLKVGSYENYKTLAGESRPTRLIFTDAIEKGKKSTITYNDIRRQSITDKTFTKDYLKKLTY